jgi:flagellar hook-associated protein 3 FlgL
MTLRITQGMMVDQSLRNIQSNQARVAVLQNQITSGSRITKPSDDPIGAAQALSLQEGLDQNTQYGKNIDQASTWLNASDLALGSVTDALHRARELAVQASNGSLSASDRTAIQAEVTQLQAHVLDMSHTKVGAEYLFSGTRSDQPGYTQAAPSGPAGVHQGNLAQVQREVSPGVTIAVNADPTTTFDPLFTALNQLQAGLTANDSSVMTASLGSFDTALNAVSTTRATLGARVNRLESLKMQQDSVSVNLTGLLSIVKDVDMASAITNFSMAQIVYQASLKASAQTMQISLLDYLK